MFVLEHKVGEGRITNTTKKKIEVLFSKSFSSLQVINSSLAHSIKYQLPRTEVLNETSEDLHITP